MLAFAASRGWRCTLLLQLLEPRCQVLVQLGHLLLILLQLRKPRAGESEGLSTSCCLGLLHLNRGKALGSLCARPTTRWQSKQGHRFQLELRRGMEYRAANHLVLSKADLWTQAKHPQASAPSPPTPPAHSRQRSLPVGFAPSRCPSGWAAPAAALAHGPGSAARSAAAGPAERPIRSIAGRSAIWERFQQGPLASDDHTLPRENASKRTQLGQDRLPACPQRASPHPTWNSRMLLLISWFATATRCSQFCRRGRHRGTRVGRSSQGGACLPCAISGWHVRRASGLSCPSPGPPGSSPAAQPGWALSHSSEPSRGMPPFGAGACGTCPGCPPVSPWPGLN